MKIPQNLGVKFWKAFVTLVIEWITKGMAGSQGETSPELAPVPLPSLRDPDKAWKSSTNPTPSPKQSI